MVLSPGSLGVLPDAHPPNMHVGGSKGSISGNFAMERGDAADRRRHARRLPVRLLRASAIRRSREVINLNADLDDLTHYNNTLTLPGDIGANLDRLTSALAKRGPRAQRGRSGLARRLRGEEGGVGGLHASARSRPSPPIDESGSGRC